MSTIFISSYYQSYQETHDDFNPTISEMLAGVVQPDGTINVSLANLGKVCQAMSSLEHDYVSPLLDYLMALYCDLEVAIQEKKIVNMATLLNYDSVVSCSSTKCPKLNFLEDFPINELPFQLNYIIDGNIFLINTHGKVGELDGDFTQSLANDLDLQRIVVDACSSSVFTSKKASVIHQLANKALQVDKNLDLEIVGFDYDFTVHNTTLTAHAVFAKRELVIGYPGLRLITLDSIKKQNDCNEESKTNKLKSRLKKLLAGEVKDDALFKKLLIDVVSKTSSQILYSLKKSSLISEEELRFLMTFNGRAELTTSEFLKEIKNDSLNKSFKIKVNTFKTLARSHIDSLVNNDLMTLSNDILYIVPRFNFDDNQLSIALKLLKIAINQKAKDLSSHTIRRNSLSAAAIHNFFDAHPRASLETDEDADILLKSTRQASHPMS